MFSALLTSCFVCLSYGTLRRCRIVSGNSVEIGMMIVRLELGMTEWRLNMGLYSYAFTDSRRGRSLKVSW